MMYVTILGVAIALCKDIPDLAGDEKQGVRTLTVRLGAERVLRIVVAVVIANYALILAASFRSTLASCAHLALAALTIFRSREVDLTKVASIRKFYMHIWLVFYLEYLVLLLIQTSQVDFAIVPMLMPFVLAFAGFAFFVALSLQKAA